MGRSRGGTWTSVSGLAILLSLGVLVYSYWHSPLRLLRYCYTLFVLFALVVVGRHLWFRLAGPLIATLGKKEQENGSVHSRPELDRGRDKARKKAQSVHHEKAEDFEQRIAAPRRELKLQQLEEKMKAIRGFQGEGAAVGLSDEWDVDEKSRLLREHDEQIRRRQLEQNMDLATHMARSSQSDSETEEENEEGKLITIALKLPNKLVKKRFKTSYKVKSLYKWLRSLNYTPKLYCLATTLPRKLLLETHQTLEQCGLTVDTALALEERD